MKIAIVGGGVAGITAAYLLGRSHDVTLFERNEYLGGHTNTRVIEDGEDAGSCIDTGFIVCNPTNYPNFYRFVAELGVELRDSDMSFGFYCEESGLQYKGPAWYELITEPLNFFRPGFLRMILDRQRFNRELLKALDEGQVKEEPIYDYVVRARCSVSFIDLYLVPLISSIWSSPGRDALNFPARTFGVFFRNHGMLDLSKRPRWQTVAGGSHAYLKAFKQIFKGKIFLDSEVASVSRTGDGVTVSVKNQEPLSFDKVVMASHADETLKLLSDPSPEESQLLGKWSYNKNRTVLHTDASVMPPKKRLWASWNYQRSKSGNDQHGVAITYYMNNLQGLETKKDYFVTLNCGDRIDPSKIIYETVYTHPVYTPESIATQEELQGINGDRNTFFCGAYMGYGFHEDAVKSSLKVAERLGISL